MTCFCAPFRRRRHQQPPCDPAEPGPSKRTPAPPPRPWHVKAPFDSVNEQPPTLAKADTASPQHVAVDLARQMLAANVDVASLDPEDMLVKYGAAWTSDNSINPSSLVGTGALGRVHRGTRCGAPAAFKVINQLSTADALLRFVRMSLPGVRQPRPSAPRHPHLLETLDCVMFPPWWALLALSRESGEDVPTVDEACASVPEAALSAPETIIPALDYKGMRSARSLGSYGTAQLRAGGQAVRNARLGPPHGALEIGRSGIPSDEGVRRSAHDLNFVESVPASLSPTLPTHARLSDERWVCHHAGDGAKQAAVDGRSESHSRGQGLSLGALSSPDSLPVFALSRRRRDGAGLPGGKVERLRDVWAQFIVVTPLCDLGTLATAVKGKAKVPVRALPPAIRAAYQAAAELASATARPSGSGEGGDHARRASLAKVRLAFLPPPFVELFKLQACLQALEGVQALHSAALVHGAIRPAAVLLQHSPSFAPFAVCAKLGDVDACRPLEPDGVGSYARPVASAPFAAPGVLPRFASYTSGCPGFVAPELVSFGRVSVETDVYALGATVMVALSSRTDLVQADAFHMKFIPEYPETIQPGVRDMLDACVRSQPRQRPSLSDLRAALLRQLESTSAAAASAGCAVIVFP